MSDVPAPGRSAAKYEVTIIRRAFQQSPDDFHATVTRISDGTTLILINDWRWFLKLRTRRWFLDREFKRYDKRQAKLGKKEAFTR